MLYYALLFVSTLVAPLRFELMLPDTVRLGQPVPITLRLTNPGRNPATVYLQGRPTAFDLVITRVDGTPVWRRLEGAAIPAILQVHPLAPGASLEFHDTWSQQTNHGAAVGPGEYLVTGVLPTDPPAELRTQPARLRILP